MNKMTHSPEVNLKNNMKSIFFRGWLLYAAVILIFLALYNEKDTMRAIKLKTLNRLRPLPIYLVQYIKGTGEFEALEADKFLYYYKTVNEYIPGRADVYGMLGFSYAHLNKKEKAVEYLSKSIEKNPYFFWNYYNLGAVYYNTGEYAQAAAYFEQALTIPKEASIKYAFSSIVYQHLIDGAMYESMQDFVDDVRADYEKTYINLILCNLRLKDYKNMLAIANYAIKLNIEDAWVFYYYAGVASFELRDFKGAITALRASINLMPTNAKAYEYLESTLRIIGDEQTAQQIQAIGKRSARFEDPALTEKEKIYPKPL